MGYICIVSGLPFIRFKMQFFIRDIKGRRKCICCKFAFNLAKNELYKVYESTFVERFVQGFQDTQPFKEIESLSFAHKQKKRQATSFSLQEVYSLSGLV